jgi:hypothetical protein
MNFLTNIKGPFGRRMRGFLFIPQVNEDLTLYSLRIEIFQIIFSSNLHLARASLALNSRWSMPHKDSMPSVAVPLI